jgi:hypothetical protein
LNPPTRAAASQKFNEGSEAWMDEVRNWYGKMKWDFEVDNSRGGVEGVAQEILDKVGQRQQAADAAAASGSGQLVPTGKLAADDMHASVEMMTS